MKLENITCRSRLFAAGLCGAAVLAFTALDVQEAQAQDEPEEPQVEKTSDKPNERITEPTREFKKEIDLSGVEFEAEVVQTVADTAVILKVDQHELLLPTSVVSLVGAQDSKAEVSDAPAEDSMGDETEKETVKNTEQAEENDVVVSDQTPDDNEVAVGDVQAADFNRGDRVTVKLDATDAQLVALENDVLTMRSQGLVMQLPARTLSDDVSSGVSFTATMNGEKQIMTLKEALDEGRELTVSEKWSTQLPANAEVAVIVANQPGKLLLATVGEGSIELVEVPQDMQAGNAVSLESGKEGAIDIGPLDQDSDDIAFEDTEISGKLVSKNNEFVVLETEQMHLLLPADLKFKDQNSEIGSEVTVILPAGNAEMLAELENSVVLETEHGIAQFPLDMLNRQSSEPVDVSSEEEATLIQY